MLLNRLTRNWQTKCERRLVLSTKIKLEERKTQGITYQLKCDCCLITVAPTATEKGKLRVQLVEVNKSEGDASVDDKVLSDCLSISEALKGEDDDDCRQRRCTSGRVTEASDI